MRTHSSLFTALVAAVFASALAGCAAAPSTAAPPAEVAPDVTRDVAIRTARGDAQNRFREMWISDVNARRLGHYWVVELRGPTGAGLRYTISTSDGSIRERNTFQ
jgi:hypothetical protein